MTDHSTATATDLQAKHGDEYIPPTSEEIQQLHHAYAEFITNTPWKQIDDGHVIVHQQPGFPVTYTVVFGNQGIAQGFNTFIGDTGLYNLSALLAGGPVSMLGVPIPNEEPMNLQESELILGLSCDREDLTDSERKLLRESGIRYRGHGRWVQIRRATPGYIPYQTDAAETRYTTAVFQDIVNIAAKIDAGVLDPNRWVNFENFLYSTYDGPGRTHAWAQPPPHPEAPDEIHFPIEHLAQKNQTYDVWLIGDALAGSVKEPDISHRPFNVRAQLTMDTATGLILNCDVPKTPATLITRQASFIKTLQDAPDIPDRVVAHDSATTIAIGPICGELDIEIAMTNRPVPQFENALRPLGSTD